MASVGVRLTDQLGHPPFLERLDILLFNFYWPQMPGNALIDGSVKALLANISEACRMSEIQKLDTG